MEKRIITKEYVQTIIRKRDKEIHKGNCGRVLIVAGSEGMAGAAILCAKGALRCGSGLVQIAVPKKLFPIVQVGVPEATCLERDLYKMDLSVYDAIAVGPGLGKSKDSVDAVRFLLQRYHGPMVMDADALNIIAEKQLFDLIKERVGGTVITPHVGEAKRLLADMDAGHLDCDGQLDCVGHLDWSDRETIAKKLYEKTGAISVLKGNATVVAIDEEETYTNTTGNPGMATAGSGDVLTGIIVSLLGQKKNGNLHKEKIDPVDGALCGVFVHGMAGDLGAKTIGEYGLLAGDIAYYTAIALKNISG